MIYIGSLILLLKLDPIATDFFKMTNPIILTQIVVYTTFFFPLAFLGVYLADKLFKTKRNVDNWIQLNTVHFISSKDNILFFLCWFSFVIVLTVFFYYLHKIPMIPFFAAFLGDSVTHFRYMAVGDLFEESLWKFKIIYFNLALVLCFIAKIKSSTTILIRWKITSFIFLLYGAFASVFSGEKGPLLFFIILIFLLSQTIKAPNFSLRQIKKYFLLLISLFIITSLMYVFLMKREINIKLYTELIHRILTGQIVGLYGIFDKFTGNYLYGKTLPPFIHRIFGTEFYNLDQEMKIYMFGMNASDIKRGIGLAPTVFFGEIYANFGPLATFISMLLVPFFLRMLELFITNYLYKDTVTLAFFTFFVYYYSNLTGSRILSIIIDVGLLFFIFLYTLLLGIKKFNYLYLKHEKNY